MLKKCLLPTFLIAVLQNYLVKSLYKYIFVFSADFICDPYYEANEASMHQGIRGLGSNAFFTNVEAKYGDSNEAISNSTAESEFNLGGRLKQGFITTDVYTSLVILVGIFFPSCTGTCTLTFLT